MPIVHAHFENRPLEEALSLLADQTEFSIVVDKRIAEKAKTPVSARFMNVPLDTAVLLLTEMADTRAIHRDNLFFVTTRAYAEELEKRIKEDKPRVKKPANVPATPTGPGAFGAFGGGPGIGGITGIGAFPGNGLGAFSGGVSGVGGTIGGFAGGGDGTHTPDVRLWRKGGDRRGPAEANAPPGVNGM